MNSRVSLINYRGAVVLDVFVQPTMPVTDYRTATTGIDATHINSGKGNDTVHADPVYALVTLNTQNRPCRLMLCSPLLQSLSAAKF